MSWDLPPVTQAIAPRFVRSYPSTTAVGPACKQGRGQSVRLGLADVLRQPLPGVTTVSFALITGLFAAIYKMMPRAKIRPGATSGSGQWSPPFCSRRGSS